MPTPTQRATLTIFTATIFLSALLLFSVQPMFAKMVLPVLGGAPAVWAYSRRPRCRDAQNYGIDPRRGH